MQMLFYEDAVPVQGARHAECFVEMRGYGFCRGVNSVPLTAVEFRSAAGEYPIVFVQSGASLWPAVVLGLRREENLMVTEQGEWLGRYIPAFVRRYPFVFSAAAGDRQMVLCVDEAFPGFNRQGRGEPLFTPAREPSPYVGRVLRFLQEYRAQFARTRAFCERLQQLELLEPMQARFTVGTMPLSLGGFLAVGRQRLKALPGDALASLAAQDELELLYLHLHSLRNFESLHHRLPFAAAEALPAAEAEKRVTVH
ncbi:SapC family protein [Ramlibacter cellulosilyticus]|uniref:SapC family protein n=1 Tax=Ramlibacter cellulosilyticus TaxID=2764187 RepID=UPI00338FB444